MLANHPNKEFMRFTVSLLESGLIIETKVKPDSRRDTMIG